MVFLYIRKSLTGISHTTFGYACTVIRILEHNQYDTIPEGAQERFIRYVLRLQRRNCEEKSGLHNVFEKN